MDDNEKACYRAREFLRIPTAIKVELVCLNQEGQIPGGIWTEAEMWEIGGGGAKIVAAIDLSVGDAICLRFTIPDTGEDMKLYGRVVGVVDRDSSGKQYKYTRIACIKFVGFSESERGKILTYAFREQIRLAKEKARAGSGTWGEETGHEDCD